LTEPVWAESRQYYAEHASRLLDTTTSTVLAELALIAPADLIDQHRRVLDAIREHGPDTA
jgi:DNA-binding FadR family transcriptional regulator